VATQIQVARTGIAPHCNSRNVGWLRCNKVLTIGLERLQHRSIPRAVVIATQALPMTNPMPWIPA